MYATFSASSKWSVHRLPLGVTDFGPSEMRVQQRFFHILLLLPWLLKSQKELSQGFKFSMGSYITKKNSNKKNQGTTLVPGGHFVGLLGVSYTSELVHGFILAEKGDNNPPKRQGTLHETLCLKLEEILIKVLKFSINNYS